MPISISKYIDITSAVGGAAVASNRELILRLYTQNELIPTGTVVEFDTDTEVGDYFDAGGVTSDEFSQAQFYFGFISKLSTQPNKISFARWTEVATVPQVFGTSAAYDFTTFAGPPTVISDGTMRVTLGSSTEDLAMNFIGDASLSDVAATIEAAFVATGGTAQFTSATVVYNAIDTRFELTAGGPTGDAVLVVESTGAGTDIAPLIGWTAPGARFSDGAAIQTMTEVLTESTQISNNYGSFSFIPTLNSTNVNLAATWNDGENVKYMYLEKVLPTASQTIFDLINGLSGTALTLYDNTLNPEEYPWLVPGMILAATPYFRRASVQNYMYQVFALTPSVTTDADSATFDAIRVNYYGQTQQAGVSVNFYQRGFLMGLPTDPIDMGVYANEIFLKDAIGTSILNLLLAVPSVPANASGIAQVLAVIQSDIERALFSGIISIGKVLDSTQKAFILAQTGQTNAFLQIQNIGYWIDAVVAEPTQNEFVVNYTLLYAKNDVVRKVEGSHTLI